MIAMLSTAVLSIAQSKQDHTWIFGKESSIETGIEGMKYNFTENHLTFDIVDIGDAVFREMSIMNDSNTGELLFYTNGCAIYNKNHTLMVNGNGLNDVNSLWESYCPGGYPGVNNTIILPDPNSVSGYYILSKPLTLYTEPSVEVFTESTNYSYVDMTLDNGLGGVILKNVPFESRRTKWGNLQACKHINGSDWWIIQILDNSNTFLIYLLDQSGLNLVNEIEEGPIHDEEDGAATQVTFNRDGSLFLLHSPQNGVLIYNFDRENGIISDHNQIILTEENSPRAVSTSPNNRFLYTSTQTKLYQFDLFSENIIESKILIDTFKPLPNELPSSFGFMLPGPDCKIYITSPSGTIYQHVINNPDSQGTSCDFKQHGVIAPYPMPALFSFVFPHFRMDEEHPCDPTLVGLADLYGTDREQISIFPNPVHDLLEIEQEIDLDVEVYTIYSISGQRMMSGDVDDISISVDVSDLEKGMYVLQLIDRLGEVFSSKFIKQ